MSNELTPGWTRALADADVALWLSANIPLLFRRIPSGEFWMGSRGIDPNEEPRHRVRITQPFYMGTFPVTQHQWSAVVKRTRKSELEPRPSYFKGDLRPVEQVSWDDAVGWCELLQGSRALADAQSKYGLTSARVGLPTEAQWEYACRAKANTKDCTDMEYYTGDGEAALAAAGWYAGNANSSTQPVGQLAQNDFGLYDMHGDVEEWCQDIWDADAYKKRVDGVCDPVLIRGPKDAVRVFRGGGWGDSPRNCRAAYRDREWPGDRSWGQGFRVCLFLGPCPVASGAEQANVGMARRDDVATPERDRVATEFFDDLSSASFPK